MSRNRSPWRSASAVLVAAALPLLGMASTAHASSNPSGNVNVVGYSVVKKAYAALESAFQATPAGSKVTFTNAFGASDTMTEDVANGQPADFVNLSFEPNVGELVTAGKVPSNWRSQELTLAGVNVGAKGGVTTNPTPGILTNSAVVFVVRTGNPENIVNWGSLVKKGVQIVTPNPLTSGSARWNLLAAYATALANRETPKQAQAFVKNLLAHTVAQPSSGSTSMAAFLGGTGNVLLDYEDDALAAQKAGDAIQIVDPAQTLLIQNPAALTDTGVKNAAAVAFYKYVFSTAGQTVLAGLGYRSVLTSVWNATSSSFASFGATKKLLTVSGLKLGGWDTLNKFLFSPTIKFPSGSSSSPSQGLVTYLEQFAGTAK